MKKIFMQLLLSLAFILVSVWLLLSLLLSLLLYLFQPAFVYYPLRNLAATPDRVGLAYRNVRLEAADGVALHAWYLPHPAPRATLLFLHGNGGNISHRLEKLAIYHRLGLAVLIVDYRGYGRSEGKPTEAGTYRDADAAWRYLTGRLGVEARDVVVYGESLGAAVAAWLAERHEPGALVVESAFISISAMGRHYYPYLPAGLLARIRYPTLAYIEAVRCPLLVIHSPDDEIVPYSHGRALYEAAGGPRALLEITGDHNSGFLASGDRYRAGLDDFLTGLFGPNG